MLAAWAARPETERSLAEGALLIAAEEYPQLCAAHYVHRLDQMAERVRDRLGDETAPLVALHELNRVLFGEVGLRGNVESYYDPRNSLLNDVLDRRLGIPITLSIVYLEVGWRLGLPLNGVNFPGRFLVAYEGEVTRLLVDPFDLGRISFEADAQALLDRWHGGAVQLRDAYLRTADKCRMLARLLTNLKAIYMSTGDHARALAAVERILVLRPDAVTEIRDRGILLGRMGRVEDAIANLELYLDVLPRAPDGRRVRRVIRELEARRGEPM